MKCPECGEELDVDIFDEYSDVVCYSCGHFKEQRFESAAAAFTYIQEA